MQQNPPYGQGVAKTPDCLKIFLLTLTASSLAAPFFPTLQALFSLSLTGVRHLFLWQLVTYPFLEISPFGISFPFFVQLAFNLYLLWMFGSTLIERSKTLFFSLFFGAAVFAGLSGLGAMSLLGTNQPLSGALIPLYAVMVAWTLIYPETTLLLLLTVPMKAIWLIFGLIGINLFIDLANAQWIGFITTFSSCLFGYAFALTAWKKRSPFAFLHPFEGWLLRLIDRTPSSRAKEPKVYDIHSGKPRLNDEQFMDTMLEKVSKLGESSLSPQERERMQQISKKRKDAR